MENQNQNCQEAIQVLTSNEEEVTVENHAALANIFLQQDVRNLPVLVFSISGKTRGGKSLLLNLMVKYLESIAHPNDIDDWITGNVPNSFTWKGGLDCVTKGVWIWPKIYRLKCNDDSEVGILLLDNQGMFDGEITDGEIIAISGISLVISYLQMFNVKEKITADYLENTVRILVKGVEEMSGENSKDNNEFRLMFVVRDWIGFDQYGFGLSNGKDYIEKESKRGSKENQMLWEEIYKTFEVVDSLLLPHPGTDVSTSHFANTGDLTMLSCDFLKEVKKFIEHIFSKENLILPAIITTGEHIYNILLSVDKRKVDDSLSFLNMFTEHINYTKLNSLKKDFDNLMGYCPSYDLQRAHFIGGIILENAENSFKGKSAPTYLAQLQQYLEIVINSMVVSFLMESYKSMIQSPVKWAHSNCWEEITRKLDQFLFGDDDTRQKNRTHFAQKAAELYYDKLKEEVIINVKNMSKNKNLERQAILVSEALSDDFKVCSDFESLANDDDYILPIWLHTHQKLQSELRNCLILRIHELTGESYENIKGSIKRQYEFFENFTLLSTNESNWDTIHVKDLKLLVKKIGFALYGVPNDRLCLVPYGATDVNNFAMNDFTGYSTSQLQNMNYIADKITSLSKSDPIQFSCIFVTFKNCSVPLFKLKLSNSKILFIDSNCRVYSGMDDFNKHNTLPEAVYCYPENGCYNKAQGFNVNFNVSPACETTSKIFKKADTAGKAVSGVAGLAAATAIVAPLAGIAIAPAVGIFGIVGGGVAGVYGVWRGVAKIVDKRNHEENVSVKDIWNLGTNVISVVSVGALGAFEKVAVTAARIAQCVSTLNAITVLCSSDDDTNLVHLLNEIEGDTLKILFYFNASSHLEAYKIIRESLKMNYLTRTDEILEKLVKLNSIQSTSDINGTLMMESYVSQGLVDLVTTLLRSIKIEIRDLVLKVASIGGAYQNLINENISIHTFKEELNSIFTHLQQNIQTENDLIRKKVFELLYGNGNDSASKIAKHEVLSTFLQEISTPDDKIVLVLRELLFSFIGRVKKANKFFNNVKHNAETLQFIDIKAHPQKELTHQIRAMFEQQESAIDLSAKDSRELDMILEKIFHFLIECAEPGWKCHQFAEQLLKITEEIVKTFDGELNKCINKVNTQQPLSCLGLETVFHQIGLNGNYGNSLLQKVLDDFSPAQKCQGTPNKNSKSFILVPAWNELIKRLYCFSSSCINYPKSELIKEILYITESNYEIMSLDSENTKICFFKPCEDSIPAFVVFSTVDKKTGNESGFIWHDK